MTGGGGGGGGTGYRGAPTPVYLGVYSQLVTPRPCDRNTGMKIAVGHRPKSDQIPSVAALFLPVTVT